MLGCRVAFWGRGSIRNGVEVAAGAETLAIVTRLLNDKPPVLAFLRFVHPHSAHDC